jgi:DegV family protein with EDD domain
VQYIGGKTMAHIRIVTDSTADIPNQLVQDLGITIVPLKVHFGKQTFADGIDIHSAEFYQRLENEKDSPTTSQPSPVDFVDVYKKLNSESEEPVHIISIHLSSALSGTVQSAHLAQSMLEEKVDITVIDSKKASYAIGIIAVAVAKAAKEGKTKEECIQLAQYLTKNTAIYFMVDNLIYLQKGGRIGKAAALFGSMLNIKPILSLDENGEVFAVDKVRGSKKALIRIIELLREFTGDSHVHVGISHAEHLQEAETLMDQLNDQFKIETKVITSIGPVIGTHVGPNALAIIMIKA